MRKTPVVKAVLELMRAAKKPLTVPEIQSLLRDLGFEPNKTTLYRMLEKFQAEGLVDAVLLDPKMVYYEIKTHHHHHFACRTCTKIRCISDDALESHIHNFEKKLEAKGFNVEEHNFSFSGTCATCT